MIEPGDRFGRLVVVSRGETKSSGNIAFNCLCDCGGVATPTASNLRRGRVESCGCIRKETFNTRSHGCSRTREHNVWKTIRQRCMNPKNQDYHLYGGRGITLCDRWMKFENFLEDIGLIPKGMSIDRVNNDLGYSKENCKLSTGTEQSLNKRTNFLITYMGETKPLKLWANQFGIGHTTISRRIKSGWTVESALTIKPENGGHNGRRSAERV